MASESSLRYIKVDYQSHKDALLSRVRARWPRSWNDFLTNSFGIVLIDLVAWATSTLAFMINRIAGENFVSTMTLRESAVRLGALVGYTLRNPTPSTVLCEATLSSPVDSDVVLPAGLVVRSSQGLAFETDQEYVIEAGATAPRTLVALFDSTRTGTQVVNTFVLVTAGSRNVDVIDTTVDVSDIVRAGQSFNKQGDTVSYTIESLESVPGSVAVYTRMVLDRPWEGATEAVAGEVFDQRITLVQGLTVTDRFEAPSEELYTTSFVAKLSRTSVIDNGVRVTVNGEPWLRVGPSQMRGSTDRVFVLRTYPDGTSAVIFGDGRFGLRVPPDAVVDVTYRVGGGLAGNIRTGEINASVTGVISDTTGPVSIAVTNRTATGVGGRDAEGLEEARTAIPIYTKANDRCVTLSDYQAMATNFSDAGVSVAYARAAVRTENALLEGNVVVLYGWTTGPDGGLVALPTQFKRSLADFLRTKAVGTDHVLVLDGTDRPVPLSLRFRVFSGFDIVDTRSLVVDTLRAFITNLRPGDTLLYSNFVRAIDEVLGVDTVEMATPIRDLTPANDMELFKVPDDTHVYPVTKNGAGTAVDATGAALSLYTAQLPVYPLAAWSFRLFLGSTELLVLPYLRPGFARVVGGTLSVDEVTDTDGDGLPDHHSTVNLLTGSVRLWIRGVPGDLSMRLVSVTGYSTVRPINVYIGYTGDNTQSKRREIRSILKAWSDQLAIGQPVYAVRVPGIQASWTSLHDVMASIPGVETVSRVALETPGSVDERVLAANYELLRLGTITLNNTTD